MVADLVVSVGQVHVAIVGHSASDDVPVVARLLSGLQSQVHANSLTNVWLLNLQNHSSIEPSNSLLAIPSRIVLNIQKVLVGVEWLFFSNYAGSVSFTPLIISSKAIARFVLSNRQLKLALN